jgi:adenylate kinase
VIYHPPKQDGVDDETGEPLQHRDDDREETIRNRLKVYHDQTKPLVDYYRSRAERGEVRFTTVAGIGSVDDIRTRVLNALS